MLAFTVSLVHGAGITGGGGGMSDGVGIRGRGCRDNWGWGGRGGWMSDGLGISGGGVFNCKVL